MNRSAALAWPPLLLASQSLVFWLASVRFGNEAGYLLGFACYWLFW